MSAGTKPIDCSIARGLIIDEALGQAGAAEAAAVQLHIVRCAECRSEAAAIGQTIALLRRPLAVKTSAGFAAQLGVELDAVDADEARSPLALVGHRLLHSRAWQLRVAAVLVPCALGVALLLRNPTPDRDDELADSVPPPAPGSGDPADSPRAPELVNSPADDDPNALPNRSGVPWTDPGERKQTPPTKPPSDQLVDNDGAASTPIGVGSAPPSEPSTGDRDLEPPVVSRAAHERALDWLARNQRADGSWTPGDGTPGFETGVTALALLAMVSHGQLGAAPAPQVPLRNAADAALEAAATRTAQWLWARQERDGRFAGGGGDWGAERVGHALATLALVERHQRLRARDPRCAAASSAHHDHLEQALSLVEITLDQAFNGEAKRHSGAVAAWSALLLATARHGGLDFHLKPASEASTERMLAQLRAERSDLYFAASHAVQAMAGRDPQPAVRDPEWARAVGTVVAGLGHAEPALRFLVASGLAGASATTRADWQMFERALTLELLPQQGATGYFEAGTTWDGLGGGTVYETALGALALQVEARQRTFIATRDALGH
ncbi:MAG: hypothetical protein EXS13_13795 [Planctomycetes bacterium]|nr:hypothetical protein [Planctomycetota bacterium]